MMKLNGFFVDIYKNDTLVGSVSVPDNEHHNLRQALTEWKTEDIKSAVFSTEFTENINKNELVKSISKQIKEFILDELEREAREMFADTIKTRKWFGNVTYGSNEFDSIYDAGELAILAKMATVGGLLDKKSSISYTTFTKNPVDFVVNSDDRAKRILESLMVKFRGLCIVYAKAKGVYWWNATNFTLEECLLVYQEVYNAMKNDQEAHENV